MAALTFSRILPDVSSPVVRAGLAAPVPERLRIFFFSDWRLQPLEWVERMLDDAGEVDLVLYGGDDLARFFPEVKADESVRQALIEMCTVAFRERVRKHLANDDEIDYLLGRRFGFGAVRSRWSWRTLAQEADKHLWKRWEGDPRELLAAAIRFSGLKPDWMPPDGEEPRTVAGVLRLLYCDIEASMFSRLARKARVGLGGVAGNDCRAVDRQVLQGARVFDLHKRPLLTDGWAFLGIEGSIYTDGRDEAASNRIGYILTPNRLVAEHLEGQAATAGLPGTRQVIVSHTPPRRALDVGLRFGVNRLGSTALRSYIRRHQPPLVLCGHCHSCGLHSTTIGNTLVINGAPDDRKVKKCGAAVVELSADGEARVEWLQPTKHSVLFMPGVGTRREELLAEVGVTTLDQLLHAPPEIARHARLRPARLAGMREALETGQPAWIIQQRVKLPEPLIFYDVETGLGLSTTDRFETEPHHPWVIGAMVEGSDTVIQWQAIDPADRSSRRRMYEGFFDFIKAHPAHTPAAWSGVSFDRYAVESGLEIYWPQKLRWWNALPQIDVLGSGIRRTVVFPAHDWSLKTVAPLIGFRGFAADEIDGFEAGLLYELHLKKREMFPVRRVLGYNAADIKALAHFVIWYRTNEALQQPMRELASTPPSERVRALLFGLDAGTVELFNRRFSRTFDVSTAVGLDALDSLGDYRPDVVFVILYLFSDLEALVPLARSHPVTKDAVITVRHRDSKATQWGLARMRSFRDE